MSIYSIVGKDSLFLNLKNIKNLAEGSTIEIAYSNNRVELATGKDENTVFSLNEGGCNATLTLRILRGSADDKYLNGLSAQQDLQDVAFTLINGTFSKRIGDGQGNITYDKYTLSGGMFQKFPNANENVNAETEQAVTIYTIVFAECKRAIA